MQLLPQDQSVEANANSTAWERFSEYLSLGWPFPFQGKVNTQYRIHLPTFIWPGWRKPGLSEPRIHRAKPPRSPQLPWEQDTAGTPPRGYHFMIPGWKKAKMYARWPPRPLAVSYHGVDSIQQREHQLDKPPFLPTRMRCSVSTSHCFTFSSTWGSQRSHFPKTGLILSPLQKYPYCEQRLPLKAALPACTEIWTM